MTGVRPTFDPVPVPGSAGTTDGASLLIEVLAWAESPPLRWLCDRFGVEMPTTPLLSGAERLGRLAAAASEVWDFRGAGAGRLERNQVDLASSAEAGTEALVTDAARALGLVDPRPPRRRRYDALVILGGLVRGNAWRSAYAAHLLATETISADRVVALTADRPLAPNPADPSRDEFVLLERLGFEKAALESDAMEQALTRSFPLPSFRRVAPAGPSGWEEGAAVRESQANGGPPVRLVVAPPDAPTGRRADTAATLRFWLRAVDPLERGSHILIVTSCIYVPYQSLVALREVALPFGLGVETIGVDISVVDTSAAPNEFRAVHYLQELLSSIRAAAEIARELEERAPSHGPES